MFKLIKWLFRGFKWYDLLTLPTFIGVFYTFKHIPNHLAYMAYPPNMDMSISMDYFINAVLIHSVLYTIACSVCYPFVIKFLMKLPLIGFIAEGLFEGHENILSGFITGKDDFADEATDTHHPVRETTYRRGYGNNYYVSHSRIIDSHVSAVTSFSSGVMMTVGGFLIRLFVSWTIWKLAWIIGLVAVPCCALFGWKTADDK